MTERHSPNAIASMAQGTVVDIIERGQAAPSREVQLKAMSIIGRGVVKRAPAIVYEVPSESEEWRTYTVSLYLKLKRDRISERRWQYSFHPDDQVWRNDVVAARCPCEYQGEVQALPATEGRAPCSHIIAALALARLDGYRLELPR